MMAIKSDRSPDNHLEAGFYQHGIETIAGIDEAGRGAWAGPVIAAAVILPHPGSALQHQLEGLQDSKLLTPARREHWDHHIRQIACSMAIGKASSSEIDQIGILPATRLAMQRAVRALPLEVKHLLIDYILIGDVGIDQTAIPRGDRTVLSIAAASVIAKVARDRLMVAFDRQYPHFGFSQHKGYGTRQHQTALHQLGPSPIHRRSFEPIRRAYADA